MPTPPEFTCALVDDPNEIGDLAVLGDRRDRIRRHRPPPAGAVAVVHTTTGRGRNAAPTTLPIGCNPHHKGRYAPGLQHDPAGYTLTGDGRGYRWTATSRLAGIHTHGID